MSPVGAKPFKPRITVFHCFNAAGDVLYPGDGACDLESVKLPCSSMVREFILLRAFESGADAVVLLTCPIGSCDYLQGNIRAGKRVARMKQLLDEIGLDGRRLTVYNIARGDREAASRAIGQTISELATLGPNPAA